MQTFKIVWSCVCFSHLKLLGSTEYVECTSICIMVFLWGEPPTLSVTRFIYLGGWEIVKLSQLAKIYSVRTKFAAGNKQWVAKNAITDRYFITSIFQSRWDFYLLWEGFCKNEKEKRNFMVNMVDFLNILLLSHDQGGENSKFSNSMNKTGEK